MGITAGARLNLELSVVSIAMVNISTTMNLFSRPENKPMAGVVRAGTGAAESFLLQESMVRRGILWDEFKISRFLKIENYSFKFGSGGSYG